MELKGKGITLIQHHKRQLQLQQCCTSPRHKQSRCTAYRP